MFKDGDKWCAIYGENIQAGICGFGDTPAEACKNFDAEWEGVTLGAPPKTVEPFWIFNQATVAIEYIGLYNTEDNVLENIGDKALFVFDRDNLKELHRVLTNELERKDHGTVPQSI